MVPTGTGPSGRQDGSRRAVVAASAVGVVVATGVVVGLAVGGSGTTHSSADRGGTYRPAPVASYLVEHVRPGAAIAALGPAASAVPPGYRTVSLTVADLADTNRFRYAVGPDPITSAGADASSFVESHATLVATDPGRATLWLIGAGGPASPSGQPSTPAPQVAPAPATALPATAPPATASPSAIVVRSGDSFWSIARSVETARLGPGATPAQIAGYWVRLVRANLDRLATAGNPDLLFAGQILVVPE